MYVWMYACMHACMHDCMMYVSMQSSPSTTYSRDDGLEVIIHDDDVRGILRHISALRGNAHVRDMIPAS